MPHTHALSANIKKQNSETQNVSFATDRAVIKVAQFRRNIEYSTHLIAVKMPSKCPTAGGQQEHYTGLSDRAMLIFFIVD